MPRGARLDALSHLHHGMLRGLARQGLFTHDTDRAAFFARLTR